MHCRFCAKCSPWSQRCTAYCIVRNQATWDRQATRGLTIAMPQFRCHLLDGTNDRDCTCIRATVAQVSPHTNPRMVHHYNVTIFGVRILDLPLPLRLAVDIGLQTCAILCFDTKRIDPNRIRLFVVDILQVTCQLVCRSSTAAVQAVMTSRLCMLQLIC